MMYHPPHVMFIGPPRHMLTFAAAAVIVCLIYANRRRRSARAQQPPAEPKAVPPVAAMPPRVRPIPVVSQPTYRPSYGSVSPMRGYFWTVVIVILAAVAVMSGMTTIHQQPAAAKISYENSNDGFDGIQAGAVQVSRAPVAPQRKPRNWLKPNRPPVIDPGPKWQATIEQSTFPSVRGLNARDKMLDKIADRLTADLHLHAPPPREFVANEEWVRTIKTEQKTLEEKDPKYGEVVVTTADVELTPQGWQQLCRLERSVVAETRMEWAARGLGLLTVLLGAIAAFIRLDEWTKGYYSGRLFLAAVVLVASLGVVIVYVVRSGSLF